MRPVRDGVRVGRRGPRPDQLRQRAARTSRRGARPDRARSCGLAGSDALTGLPRVLVTRVIPDEGLARIREACDLDLWEDELPPPRDELLRRVAGVDGLLALLTDRVDDELLDAAGPGLRVVSNYAVGFDNVDVPACTRRGIAVGNTPGVLTETTADLAWTLLMAAARRIPEADRYVREGRWLTWGPMTLLGPDVHGATVGIVGFGRIGQAVARRARAASGCASCTTTSSACPRTWRRRPARRHVPLDELLARRRLRVAPRQPDGGDAPPGRRARPRAGCSRRRSSSTRRAARSSTPMRSPTRSATGRSGRPRST